MSTVERSSSRVFPVCRHARRWPCASAIIVATALLSAHAAAALASPPSTTTHLNWRSPNRHIRNGSNQGGASRTAAGKATGCQRATWRVAAGPPVGRAEGQAIGQTGPPLVQPANFQSPSPFDDPFGDLAPSKEGARPDLLDESVSSTNDNDTSAPGLIRPRVGRPINATMNLPNRSGPTLRPVLDSVQLAQSQGQAASSDLEFPLVPSPTAGDANAGQQSAEALNADGNSPPAPDGLTSEDLAPRQGQPGDAAMDESTLDRQDANRGSLGTMDSGNHGVEGYGSDSRDVPCDRFYGPGAAGDGHSGKRNCCEEEQGCETALALLKSKPITTISLDIAPPFDPQPDATNFDPDKQAKNLAQAKPRVWRDRNGRVLGQGRLVDLDSSHVIIVGNDGQRKPIPFYALGDDDLCFLNAWWGTPPECQLGDEPATPRQWQLTTFTWKASGLCHKPLYFEEQRLERYGHSAGPIRQPVLSAAHFVLGLALLPYDMGIHPPSECIYALGYYRPGSCAPWLVPAFPLSLRGAASQAVAIAALVPLPY